MATERITLAQARRAWLARQRLDASGTAPGPTTLAIAVSSMGWLPLASPSSGYLALFARGALTRRAELDDALYKSNELSVVPGPQGVPHLVPTGEAPLARAFAVADHASREARVAASADLTARDLTLARDALKSALATPRTAEELAAALPPETLRSLGDAGKKNGIPTPAALVLRALWSAGEVRRETAERTLDGPTVRWSLEARPKLPVSAADAVAPVAARWVAAHAPVRARTFAGSFGLAAGRASSALAPLGFREVTIEGLEGNFLVPTDFSAPTGDDAPSVHLLPLRDSLTDVHLSELATPSAARAVMTKQHGPGAVVLVDNEVRALWSYDEVARLVVWRPCPDASIGAAERERIDVAALHLTRFITSELGSLLLHSPPALARPRPSGGARPERSLDLV